MKLHLKFLLVVTPSLSWLIPWKKQMRNLFVGLSRIKYVDMVPPISYKQITHLSMRVHCSWNMFVLYGSNYGNLNCNIKNRTMLKIHDNYWSLASIAFFIFPAQHRIFVLVHLFFMLYLELNRQAQHFWWWPFTLQTWHGLFWWYQFFTSLLILWICLLSYWSWQTIISFTTQGGLYLVD